MTKYRHSVPWLLRPSAAPYLSCFLGISSAHSLRPTVANKLPFGAEEEHAEFKGNGIGSPEGMVIAHIKVQVHSAFLKATLSEGSVSS